MEQLLATGWRRFGAPDWDDLAGAKKFPDGRNPLFRDAAVDGVEAEMVVDADGAAVFLYDNPDSAEPTYWAGTSWASVAYLLFTEDVTADGLRAAGFTLPLAF